MSTPLTVTKRDGSIQELDINKIHQVLEWATEDLSNVFISEIETKSGLQFYNEIPTNTIHDLLIDTAAKLISEEASDYQYVASRLAIMKLRKDVYGDIKPHSLYSIIESNIKENVYDKSILEAYTKEEIEYFDSIIDHDKDYEIAYAGLTQFISKYLVKNRVTEKIYETPQIANMLISMVSFIKYEPKQRKKYVEDFYEMLSDFKISLPTPIMAGLRTCTKQFSSCVLIDCGDSLDSISATADAMLQYSSRRAGIGLNVGRIRALNSSIRGGEAYHTGIIPYIKMFEATIHSCSQGSIRKSSATLHYPIWHLEVEDLLVLKNNKGTHETRVRHVDYSIQINKLFYERLQRNENITLFSPNEVPGLYEAFFRDQEKFKELYLKYEKDKSIRKVVVKAESIFDSLVTERLQTGRIYIMNVDHCNSMGPFDEKLAPIYMSNLCQEITLRTQPLNKWNPEEGQISLCTLAGINAGRLKKLEEMEYICELLVRSLDGILSYQNYPLPAAANTVALDRALGIGIINFAYYLAKNKVQFGSQESFKLTHDLFECLQYYSLKASNKLAKEFGKCNGFGDSKYSKGIMPIDRYKKSVDELYSGEYLCNWEELKNNIMQYGLRNNTVTAQFPAETSAIISNSTNGIEAIRDYSVVKTAKGMTSTYIVPELKKYRNYYTIAWDITQENYIKVMAVMQKFIDQSISTNIYYDNRKTDGNMSIIKLKRDLLTAYKYGIKTLYYANTYVEENSESDKLQESSKNNDDSSDGCGGGGCVV